MSIDFDPTLVRPRRRRVDPVLLAVAGIVIALGAAILKPWDQTTGPGPAASPAAAAADASASPATPSTFVAIPRPARPAAAAPPTWGEFSSIVQAFDGWGAHTVARRHTPPWSSDEPTYIEAWAPTKLGGDGRPEAIIEPGDGPVVLLGVTVPSEVRPDAARIWRVHADAQLEWIDAHQIDPVEPRGSLLFLRPGTDGASYDPWPAGHYRIDLLNPLGVLPIAVQVTDRAGAVPSLDEWAPVEAHIVPSAMSDPPGVFSGMFAFVDGVGHSIPAQPFRPLDGDEAWRDLTNGGVGVVGSVYLPRTSGLGVMLPSGARVDKAELHRLAPETNFTAPAPIRGNSDRRGRSPFVMFEAPPGEAWPAGVYAITVGWTYRGSVREDTWHVELRPGPQ